jgi:hypothetical protein
MSEKVAPFYVEGQPPCPLYLLFSQTELFADSPVLPGSNFQSTELKPFGLGAKRTTINTGALRHSPYPKSNPKLERHAATSDNPTEAISEEVELSSDNDSFCNPPPGAILVKKPAGEGGRPGSGGFNIEQESKWSPEYYKAFKVQIKLVQSLTTHAYLRTTSMLWLKTTWF